MTALMWAAWKISAIDPVRLLLTLGANPSVVDHTHGNTALHWAILARNATAISTLIFKGKSVLDIANLRGDTPLTMLQMQAGSIWIGQKVVERIVEMNQSTQKRNVCVRIHTDKVRGIYARDMVLDYLTIFCLPICSAFAGGAWQRHRFSHSTWLA